MRERWRLLSIVMILFLSLNCWGNEISSLSQIFLLGKGIQDLDSDSLADKVSLFIVIPDNPTAQEIAVASDIAARANFESLVVDFSLVRKESEIEGSEILVNPILVGTNLNLIGKLAKQGKINPSRLNHHQGLVTIFSYKNQKGIALVAGSEEALLHTGRAFFLRWPYFWEIWGREQGATYFTLEADLAQLLKDEGISFARMTIRDALYEFPPTKSPHESIKRLKFNLGEIKNLTVEIDFDSKEQQEQAFRALGTLQRQHLRGLRTDVLSYPGCSRITFELQTGQSRREISRIFLRRLGYPKRILTPSYKRPVRAKISGKDFDLLSLFSSKGFYSDSNKDNILDSLDASIIIPHSSGKPGSPSIKGTDLLASRLVLASAGASFPILLLDEEIESIKALKAPILIGRDNSLNIELIKTGKLKISPPLEKGWGMVKVVTEAFNKSNALSIIGADREGLEKTLAYISQTFPYFDEYKEGNPKINDLPTALEEFFKGKEGSAEAYFLQMLEKTVEDIKDKDFESFSVKLYLPKKNQKFKEYVQKYLKDSLSTKKLEIQSYALRDSKTIFEKQKDFPWEGDEAIRLIQEKINTLKGTDQPLKISLGVSESPEVRNTLKKRIESLLVQNNIFAHDVEVLSSYKQGFFWLLEKVVPALNLKNKKIHRLTIGFAEEKDNFKQIKRFYTEPFRWLQELYPVDEIIAKKTDIPLDRIDFEMKEDTEPVYEVRAYDDKNNLQFEDNFSPQTREALFLKVLPEWGKVKLTTGWLRMKQGKKAVLDTSLKSDLERFWDFYQDEILAGVYSHILKKTGNEPSFKKQPYFKRLLIEMWFSEPDYRLGLDEEIISSLEAMHDEIYFDTLDFLRGITEIELEDEDIPEDTSRYSAPGNILPLIHPSLEGKGGKVKVTFDDQQASSPQLVLRWKEKGREEHSKKIVFPSIKAKTLRMPSFVYNGQKERIENLIMEVEIEKEKEYLALIEIIDSLRGLQKQHILPPTFSYPRLNSITLRVRFKKLEKEESFPVFYEYEWEEEKTAPENQPREETIVPTDKIISPQMCLDMVCRLGRYKTIRSYIAGKSYEGRKVPVLEIFTPLERYVSLPRLITFKPTLYLSGRQHANEVCSTNYILKFAELLAKDKDYKEYLKKMNFILHPMENPDGAELAYSLQKISPFHSLHAGRYSSLGIDVGYQVGVSKPILPEAKVRRNLYNRWLPDIYLNLHGYPSHEWVQQFSNYSPYLFRDYWIPRGWFVYFRALSIPLYKKWMEAGGKLKEFIIEELNANKRISESNKKFYDRYFRWAARWQPHMNYLEIYDGINLYAKRRSSQESKLSPRRQITFAEEIPELMDETAHDDWFDFLCTQGLTYLRAHVKYLDQAEYEIARIEEESQERIHIQFIRSRPGEIKKKKK